MNTKGQNRSWTGWRRVSQHMTWGTGEVCLNARNHEIDTPVGGYNNLLPVTSGGEAYAHA